MPQTAAGIRFPAHALSFFAVVVLSSAGTQAEARPSGCLTGLSCDMTVVGAARADTARPGARAGRHSARGRIPRAETAPLQDDIRLASGAFPLRSRKRSADDVTTPSLRRVPDLLDNLYRYNVNSISDLVTYESPEGTLVQLLSYWADDRRLHVTSRSFPDGEFSTPIDVHDAVHGDGEPLHYDSHNSSAIGVASNGVMFIGGNQHVSELNMAKTTTPYDPGSFSALLPEQMVASSEVNRVTYPSFFTHDGYLYFSYREQEVGQGAPRFRWMINRYVPERDEWQTAVQFNTGISLRMYVSNVAVAPDGDYMHAFAIWRDDAAGGGVAAQRDYLHLYSADGSRWRIAKSDTVVTAARPLWYDNGVTTLPGYTGVELSEAEKIWATPPDPRPRSAGVAAVDADGRAHALVKDYSGVLHHHRWEGKHWQSVKLGGWPAQSFDIVACPSATGALLSRNDRIHYRSFDPRDASHDTPVLLAEGFTTSDFSLSVDKEAIRFGYVSFLLTRNSHFPPGTHGADVDVNAQPAWIATFHCSQLHDAFPFTRLD